MKNANQNKSLITELIVQGLLMLLESEVVVRCRECDVQTVEGCLQPAIDMYQKSIKNETGATKTCKLNIDKAQYLDPKGLGGVILSCQDGKITIDNTVDLRLSLVMEQDKPAIRKMLFPAN